MAGMISMHLEQFLEDAFLRILNMSMTASYIIAAVIIAQLSPLISERIGRRRTGTTASSRQGGLSGR